MANAFRPRSLVLFVGDICFFIFSLWLALFLRVLQVPSQEVFVQHLVPFSLLFVAWVVVFFIAGLYENRSIILQRRAISAALLVAQSINMLIAALFFFFLPIFGIAPKTLLLIYLVVSFLLVLFWRVALFPVLGLQRPERALLVGDGSEIHELAEALKAAPRAPARIVEVIAPHGALAGQVRAAIERHRPGFIIADFTNPTVAGAFPELYNYISQGIRFIDALALYEEIFGRIPLSLLNDQWLARNVSIYAHTLYDALKRAMDIVIALPTSILSLVLYPFIMAAIYLEDGAPAFVSLPRVGEGGRTIHIRKFRSMTGNDSGDYGEDGASKLHVTRVGRWLRLFRTDELPQLWEVLAGTQSLIGPRPETPALVAQYEKQIPYYQIRHLIKPGLSGWAQLYGEHAHHGVDLDTTKNKLSYDLYYIKHRSLLLDVTIALKTIKKLLTRSGV